MRLHHFHYCTSGTCGKWGILQVNWTHTHMYGYPMIECILWRDSFTANTWQVLNLKTSSVSIANAVCVWVGGKEMESTCPQTCFLGDNSPRGQCTVVLISWVCTCRISTESTLGRKSQGKRGSQLQFAKREIKFQPLEENKKWKWKMKNAKP